MTLPALRDLIDQHFSDDELRQLCFDLDVEYENLPGDTRIIKAQSLIQHCLRHNRLPDLGERCQALRPDASWPDVETLAAELAEIEQTASTLTATVKNENRLAAMLEQLHQDEIVLLTQLLGNDAVALGENAKAVGKQGVMVEGDVGGDITTGQKIVVTAEKGATVVINDSDETDAAFDRDTALNRYLTHVIAHNRYLQLQGVHSGGRLVHIELVQIYVTLRATRQRTVSDEERWLAAEAEFAPGERHRVPHHDEKKSTETVTVKVDEALANHRRLVVLGDPGSGKTTLLRYLTLLYARDLAGQARTVQKLLGLDETGRLPILLPLRQLGAFLRSNAEASVEGHRLLLDFLQRYLQNERIDVPLNFFDAYLTSGQAVVMLDGMDEVAGTELRRRVARLIESFTRAYPNCRFVVTSRIVGYTGAARLGEEYATTTVQDFTLADVEQFLSYWHRLIFVNQMGPGEPAQHAAQRQTQHLLSAIRANERIRELAINPLLLTVIALVHRDRVKLPDRRAELYDEAIAVLLGKWDEARGVLPEQPILPDRPFDTTDRRLLLQNVALHMHEQQQKEIETRVLNLAFCATNFFIPKQCLYNYDKTQLNQVNTSEEK